MSIEIVNYVEWVLMAAFLLAALDTRFISLCMLANIAIGHFAYGWMLGIPPDAAAAFITLLNVTTIMLILWRGVGVQKVLQPLVLLGFIALEPIISVSLIYNNYEFILMALYSFMFLTISRSAGRGVYSIYKFVNGINRSRSFSNGATIFRHHTDTGVGAIQTSRGCTVEKDS